MCYPMDVDVARDLHSERTHNLEVENRVALNATARNAQRRR